MSITGVTLQNGTVTGVGAGIYAPYHPTRLAITGCIIRNNHEMGTWPEGQGGGIVFDGTIAAIDDPRLIIDHAVISAPIDGVVIARNVDVGQTVAASFQAPVLFVIANDLSRMQVNASIDEADIGRVRAGQDVGFRVDAHPERAFSGKVEQVRLQPITSQNVVT